MTITTATSRMGCL